jgi:curved DNA-binding protein CbpA
VSRLYDILGVSPNASIGEIRAAWRAAAKRHHPDVGGDARAFHELSRAWGVLSSPGRRQQYDRTGDEGGDSQSVDTQAHSIVAQLVTLAIQQMPADGLITVDLVANMLGVVEGRTREAQASITQMEASVRRLERLAGRFHPRQPGGVNVMRGVVETHMRDLRRQLVDAREGLEVLARARELVQAHRFEADPPPSNSYTFSSGITGRVTTT